MISNASDQPFGSKRAIARHFRVHERTIFGWELKHDWPKVPTPRSVTDFLERNEMDSRPSRQRAELLERFDGPYSSRLERLTDHVADCQEASKALPAETSERCLAEIDECLLAAARALLQMMTTSLTGDQVAQYLSDDAEASQAILDTVNPYLDQEDP